MYSQSTAPATALFNGVRALAGSPITPLPLGPVPGAEPVRSSVLVVEDEPLVRLVVCDALEGAGLAVEEAADADGALGLLAGTRADRGWCQVLVTDVNLGRGPDGIELAAEARRSNPDLRVLYITGNPERVLRGWTAPRPQEFVLGKPFQVSELIAAVRWLSAPANDEAPCPLAAGRFRRGAAGDA